MSFRIIEYHRLAILALNLHSVFIFLHALLPTCWVKVYIYSYIHGPEKVRKTIMRSIISGLV